MNDGTGKFRHFGSVFLQQQRAGHFEVDDQFFTAIQIHNQVFAMADNIQDLLSGNAPGKFCRVLPFDHPFPEQRHFGNSAADDMWQ